jgi:hypothetical protein
MWLAGGVVLVGAPWLPGWLTAVGLDVWNIPAVAARAEAIRRAGRELDHDITTSLQVLRAKDALLADLRSGRISLTAAAELYCQMVAGCPQYLAGLRFYYPDAGSDPERAALRLTEQAVAGTPDPDRGVLAARLDAEYRDRFRPGPPPAAYAARVD